MSDEPLAIRILIISILGVILVVSVIGITLVAIFTDRDLFRASLLIFASTLLLTAFGGIGWTAVRRHRKKHWGIRLERDENGETNNNAK